MQFDDEVPGCSKYLYPQNQQKIPVVDMEVDQSAEDISSLPGELDESLISQIEDMHVAGEYSSSFGHGEEENYMDLFDIEVEEEDYRPLSHAERTAKWRQKKKEEQELKKLYTQPKGVSRTSTKQKKAVTTFRKKLMNVLVELCFICWERFPGGKVHKNICRRCSLDKNVPKKFSAENEMDPGILPNQLKGLSMVEQSLVARACPVTVVFRLPSGQYKFRGHVISFAQDVTSFANILPRLPSEIKIVVVRREFSDGHADFRVRRGVVQAAMEWLVENNPDYSDVIIDEKRLEVLPVDGNVFDLMDVVEDKDEHQFHNARLSKKNNTENIEEENFENIENVIPFSTSLIGNDIVNQEQLITETLNNIGDDNVIPWPPQDPEPLSEFTELSLFSRCFPCLFPHGGCELNSSRPIKVSLKEMAKHLMKYSDGRFANHPTFKYYLLNRIMRMDAIKKGGLFYKMQEGKVPPTVMELKDQLKNGGLKELVKRIVYFGGKSHGSSSMWGEARKNVQAMVEQIGIPSFFLTLSAADHHWPEVDKVIQQLYGPVEKTTVNNINGYPLAASWLFQERIRMFFQSVLPCILELDDFFFRYEWQSRGSPHIHGLLWTRDAPDVSRIEEERIRRRIEHYFHEFLVTMVFYKTDQEAQAIRERVRQSNPCSRNPLEIEDEWLDYLDLVELCQPHLWCGSYCMKYDKNTKTYKCKFDFPQVIKLRTVLEKINNKWKLMTERNNVWINSHNIDILKVWRANIDLKAVIDLQAVINYLLKYCVKTETLSRTSAELFTILLDECPDETKTISIIQKVLNNLIGHRDYSAQETCHLLMGWPLCRYSRQLVSLKMGIYNQYALLGSTGRKSVFCCYQEEYYSRNLNDESIRDMSLFEYIRKFNRKNKDGVITERTKVPVLVVYPFLTVDPECEEFCRQYLILHKPHKSPAELIFPFINSIVAYQNLVQDNLNLHEILDVEAQLNDVEEEQEEELEDRDRIGTQSAWMAAQGLLPRSKIITHVGLGDRPIDRLCDWGQHSELIPELKTVCDQIEQFKKEEVVNDTIQTNLTLNSDQKAVLDYVEHMLLSDTMDPCNIFVYGVGGTGKSRLIAALKALITSIFGEGSVVLVAPTGVASNNIGGQTLHSLISHRRNAFGDLLDLKGLAEKKLQSRLGPVKVGILDECSMMGLKMLGDMHKRLKQAKPAAKPSSVLGGIIWIFVGDNGQLPCVGDKPSYCREKDGEDVPVQFAAGYKVLKSFKKFFVLSQQMRQTGDGEDDVEFRNVLSRLRDGISTLDDFRFLNKRYISNLSRDEIKKFDDAIRVFSRNADCEAYNMKKLRQNKKPVAKIVSQDHGTTGDYKGSLEKLLYLSEGCSVMLTQNLWVGGGLVNGSRGTVEKIVYPEDGKGNPLYIVCRFESYTGPSFFPDSKLVVIKPQCHSFLCGNGKQGRRVQFPLMLAYAVTIHKVQGLTLDLMVLDIGPTEFASGLSYVGFSRVTNINNIMIVGEFSYDRISKLWDKYYVKERKNYEMHMFSAENIDGNNVVERGQYEHEESRNMTN